MNKVSTEGVKPQQPAPNTTPASPAAPATGPAATSSPGGALETNLSPELLATIEPMDAYAPTAESRSTSSDTPRVKDDLGEADSPRRSAPKEKTDNPFKPLTERRVAAGARPTPKSIDLQEELDPDFDALLRLSQIEGKLGGEKPEVFGRLRKGVLLLTADGQATRGKTMPVDGEKLADLAKQILAKKAAAVREDVKAFAKLNARFLAGGKRSIQAFVQRVLRESYAIQNDLLIDYAEKVKFYNEQKKAIRERLKAARETQANWTTLAGGDEGFFADIPFEALQLDDNGEWSAQEMTAEDVESWHAAKAAAARAGGSTASGMSLDEQFTQFTGESGLSSEQRLLLDEMLKDKDGLITFDSKNDDFIVAHIDDLLMAIPAMNQEDLVKYMPRIIEYLTRGKPDKEELLLIYRAFTPVQMLYLSSVGYDANGVIQRAKRIFEAYDLYDPDGRYNVKQRLDLLSPLPVATVADSLTGAIAAFQQVLFGLEDVKSEIELLKKTTAGSVAEELNVSLDGDGSPDDAAALLVVLGERVRVRAEETAGDGAPRVGSPKQIYTREGLDVYIKELEERMNGIADNSQLANVDLQNALQKQQQTLQMLSNIAKMLHETALSIVRKMAQ